MHAAGSTATEGVAKGAAATRRGGVDATAWRMQRYRDDDVDEKAERTRTNSATTTVDADESATTTADADGEPTRRRPAILRTPSAVVKSLVLIVLPPYDISCACCILVMSMTSIYACLIIKMIW